MSKTSDLTDVDRIRNLEHEASSSFCDSLLSSLRITSLGLFNTDLVNVGARNTSLVDLTRPPLSIRRP